MAAKKITKVVKLQLNAGKATPAPPVGPVLSPTGINTQQFCVKFNDQTKDMVGYMIPVIVTVYDDRSFSFITKTPPASDLLKKAAGIESGSSNAKKIKVATISREKIKEIATTKLPDLSAYTVEAGMKIIEGTARNMGIVVEDSFIIKQILNNEDSKPQIKLNTQLNLWEEFPLDHIKEEKIWLKKVKNIKKLLN